jgi:hypothetical protein
MSPALPGIAVEFDARAGLLATHRDEEGAVVFGDVIVSIDKKQVKKMAWKPQQRQRDSS